jgi:two-component system, chemotaxis family, CheB/CheR fusion protein
MSDGQPNSNGCLIAAIGASAGGLEAFEKFFRNVPPDPDVAFVIVQHLAPDHESVLPRLLARYTGMPVEQVQDHTEVSPNQVYVIPPNASLVIKHRVLRLSVPAEPRGHRTPIDRLFRSLAEDQGENAVCIILSGTGTDGTLGLRAIKEHGGMAMAQTLESAKYDAILRSAIATGLVDHVVTAEEMPAKLLEYATHLKSLNGKPFSIRKQLAAHLGKIMVLLRRKTGHDFGQYKETTIARRLERRMKVLRIETVEQYVDFLEQQPDEIEQLFRDLLVGVTQFFRDPEAFEALGQEVIPKLFAGKRTEDQIRVGVVGCASGEEAYSIAILLSEHLSKIEKAPQIKIFATDIDERGLEIARKGLYPASMAEHVSAERLERFFIKHDGAYQVKRQVREMCIFSMHSFIKDPPFSRLDLISCRNVMIYLGLDLQRKVIPLFHYALRPGAFLFLGPSENASAHRELFGTIDKKHRIFQRKQGLPRPAIQFPLSEIARPARPGGKHASNEDHSLSVELERIILQRYAPACVIVKENGDAVYFSGRTGRYLQQPTGTPDINVFNMAREGLRMALRAALHRATSANQPAVQKGSIQNDGTTSRIHVAVEPITEIQGGGLYMISFEEPTPDGTDAHDGEPGNDSRSHEAIEHLENELRSTEEHLQSTVEELETSNEELRSANEEYQSMNEELESSKEEMQSFNEELETVNNELNRKVAELDHANGDLQNLLDSTQIATIFLDAELRVQSFTPASTSMFPLMSGDIGRPITDLTAQFSDTGMVEDIREVVRTVSVRQRELRSPQGRQYLMRIVPYRTVHHTVDGVVITFVDVTHLKEAELYAESIVAAVREPLLVLDHDLRVRSANKAYYDMFQTDPAATDGHILTELDNGRWDIPELIRRLDEVLPQSGALDNLEIEQDIAGKGSKTMLLSTRRIDDMQLILLEILDITERKRSEDQLRNLNADLLHFSYAASHDLQEPLRMVMSYTQLLERDYKGRLDPRADKFIRYAVEGAHRMETLLRDLREYWSVNEQKLDEPTSPIDCNEVVDKAIHLLEVAIQESGAQITREALPRIIVEAVPFTLLFQNLLSNAIKYRRPDQLPTIHISAEKKKHIWVFSVADNGIGIAKEHFERIFAPFKRLHGAEYSGSGMGLAICQKVVERYGGRIWVESRHGQGSQFKFSIPV